MKHSTMVKKYILAINEISDDWFEPDRTVPFCNAVSQYANDKFGLNAAATTAEDNAFIEALDTYFK